MEFLTPEILKIFGQLTLAVLLGSLIGMERELARKTAGMRTFSLVALGSTMFSLISRMGFLQFSGSGFDPSRIASQVVVGIGFLGAGLIILRQEKVQGLTTAAGLWVSAAIGMAVAFEFYAMAIFATILTIFVLVFLWLIEHRVIKKWQHVASDSDEEHD